MIRKTLDTDIPAVMAIYDAARAFMRAHGNATQWPEGTPSAEQLAADIAARGSYVCGGLNTSDVCLFTGPGRVL